MQSFKKEIRNSHISKYYSEILFRNIIYARYSLEIYVAVLQ